MSVIELKHKEIVIYPSLNSEIPSTSMIILKDIQIRIYRDSSSSNKHNHSSITFYLES